MLSLQNGYISGTETISESFFRMQKAGGGFQTNLDGKAPAGPGSLLTFLPLTADFDQATSVTLHRYLDDSVLAPITDFPVAAVTVSDGYDTTTTSYSFDENTAYVDASGTVAKYYRATVYPGTANPSNPLNGSIEHYFVNGQPSAGLLQNLPVYPSVVDGNPHKTIGYDSQGGVVLETDIDWQVFTTVQDLDGGGVRPLFGNFVRMRPDDDD